MERHLHHPRRSRRVMLPDRKLLPAELSCNAACRGLSARPMHPFGSPSEDNAHGTASPTPAPESARQPPAGKIISKFDFHRRRQGAFRSPLHPFGSFLPKQSTIPWDGKTQSATWSARQPQAEKNFNKYGFHRYSQELFRGENRRCGPNCRVR